jgi:hypothetical protein
VPFCVQLFQKIKERNDAEKAKLPNNPIKITLPDGTVKEGLSHKTTPFEIAMGNGLAQLHAPMMLHARPNDAACSNAHASSRRTAVP